MNVRRLWVIPCLLAVALVVTACGSATHKAPPPGTLTGHEVGSEENDGE